MSQYSQLRRAGLPTIFVFELPDELPLVNVTAGTIAFIESINGLFIYNNGWRPLDTSSDGPVITTAPLSITVESGTTYTTIIESTDPDGLPVIYGATTTGSIAENTQVTIDEDTGVLTLLSNNPYADNFSIILTCSDGVFATTRTIPVTIVNREPVFTVEPAAAITANSGVEFSYQYTVTDPDDSTTLDFTVTQDLATVFPNFQHIQRIHPKSSSDQTLQPTYGRHTSTGGDYLVITPFQYIENGVYVYKLDTTTNEFKLFQTEIVVQSPIGNTSTSYAASAVSNNFLYVSEQLDANTHAEKILKYDSNTDQFVEWSGGNLGSAYTSDDRFILSAEFCKTSDGNTALLVGSEGAGNAVGKLRLFVYDQESDQWVFKQSYLNGSHSPFQRLEDAVVETRVFTWPLFIQKNPWKEHEVSVRANSSQSIIEVLLDDDQGSVADNVYELKDHLIAFGRDGLGEVYSGIQVFDTNGTALFFESENTIWASQPNGELFKLERGTTLDTVNQNPWLSDSYTGGTASITHYSSVTGSYVEEAIEGIGYDTLIVNGSVGSLGIYTFQLNNLTNSVQYIYNFASHMSNRFQIGSRSSTSTNISSNSIIRFNRDRNIVINIGIDSNWYECYINTFGFGVNINVDTDGTVVGAPKSFGTYNITTSVSDSIDTISDTVSLEVPIGINFTQTPPASKTIDANSVQSFTTDATTSNYNKNARLKISSDIPYEYKTAITGATAASVKGNELIVLVDQEVRVYTIDGLGELSDSYTVVDTSSIAGDYSRITDIYSTDDYIVLGRKGIDDSAGISQQHIATRDLTQSWGYTTDSLGRITGISASTMYKKYIDLHQSDQNASRFFEYSYRETADSPTLTNEFFSIDLKEYDPITNRITSLNTNSITINIADNERREHPRFFKTYHKDWTGTDGTGVGYLLHYVYGVNAATVFKFEYDKDGNINTLYTQNFDTSDQGLVAGSSSDGSYFATAYKYIDRTIIIKGPDADGIERTWQYSASAGNFDYYKFCNFIKINNEYHLATLFYNYSNSTYDISIWEIPTADGDPITLASTYSVDFTDLNVNDLVGPIGSDNDNNLIVGNWLFTITTLTKALTKQSVMSSSLTGISSEPSRLEYSADIDTWFYYSSTVLGDTGTGLYPEGPGRTYAFKINPITKAVTNVAATTLGTNSYIVNTGMNQLGEYITVSQNFDDPRTSDYPRRVDIQTRYYVGYTFGGGELVLYSKDQGTYSYHSTITKSSNTVLGNIVGNILKITSSETNNDYLIISYPWHLSTTDDAQGGIYSYTYNEDSQIWDEVSFLEKTYTEFDTGNTRDNERQYNNFGHSVSKYDNFIIESGPRDIDDNGNTYHNNPINILGPRDGLSRIDRTFQKTFPDTTLRNLDGYTETSFAKSYLALGNTGTNGNYFLDKNGELLVFNSAYNSPLFSLQESATTSPITFDNKNIIVPPEPFDGGTNIYSSGGALEIYDGGEAKPFEPDGDYTIEFHFKHASIGSCYILSTIGYRGSFTQFDAYFKLYVHNQSLYLTNNWGTTNGLPPSNPEGVNWVNVALADNVWRHYAIVYDSVNEQHTLWVDGVKSSTTSYLSNPKIWKSAITDTYYWSVGRHRSDMPDNTDQASTTDFSVANIIVNLDAQYNPDNNIIDISVFENGTIADKVTDKTWGAFCIGKEQWVDYVGRDQEYSDSGTRFSGVIDGGRTSAPDIYTPQTIENKHWSKKLHGNDNILISANDNNLYIYNRGVDNKFKFEKYFNVTGIKKIETVDNESDTVVVLTDSGVKLYSRNTSAYFRSAASISNGTVTLNPKYLTSGTYTLTTVATDSINTSIKNTAITQNSVFDVSTVIDQTIGVEWGSTDTQTLPVSDVYATAWSTQFTNAGNPNSQLQLSENTLTVTPSNVSHDTFAANLAATLEGETKTIANYKYQTYAPWKFGPATQYDYATEDSLLGFRPLTPDLVPAGAADISFMYGRSVSMSEIDQTNTTGYLVVGQPRSNYDNTSAMTATGEVYVYQWNNSQGANDPAFVGSEHRQRLQNSITFGTDTDTQGQHFGWIVDITPAGETILATAPGIDTLSVDETASSSGQAGAVIYARQSDGTHAVSTSIDFADITLGSSQLGTAAAISDDASTIVFGSANYPVNTNQNGLVSIWRRTSTGTYTSFSLIDHVTNSWANGSRTGESVAVSADGSVVAIGQPNPSGTGAVLVYKYTDNGYQLAETIGSFVSGGEFGYSLAMTPDGGTIVAGTPGRTVSPGTQVGGFVVYDGDTTTGYTETYVYTPDDTTGGVVTGERIGTSVTIDKFGSTIIAGGPYTAGAPRTGGSRSGNNYEIGHIYTAYKTSGSWNKSYYYLPDSTDNWIRYSFNSDDWKNKTFGYSVALSPNGSHLAVGDPTLGGELGTAAPESVDVYTPAVTRLRQQILDLNPTLFNTANINRNTGTLITINPITMGSGSPTSIELPVDFWPTGIGSIADYSANVITGTDGVSVSFNSSTNSLDIAHTRNATTVSGGSSLIALDLSFKTISNNFVFQIGWQ